jgi:hypothetical protein
MTKLMDWAPGSIIRWLFDSEQGDSQRLIPRWIFLRALGLIYFSAFYSLVFQIRGLTGPNGILPASEFLETLSRFGPTRFWIAPTLLWLSSSSHMLMALCWVGMLASLLLTFNLWPRGMLLICFLCFLSFVTAAQDFSGYQSDGMLLEAGFISLFFAPPGLRPRLAGSHPPSRASQFLLLWECFRIYFESGVVKLASGDPQWRNFTAMDEYYQNGPLPTWIGWYVQHLPHRIHAFATGATLVMELGLVWMFFLPRPVRIACFFIVTPWQAMVILTANYTFLNYLVLALGFLLLDDRFIRRVLPPRWSGRLETQLSVPEPAPNQNLETSTALPAPLPRPSHFPALRLALVSVVLIWILYATTVQMVMIVFPFPFPTSPVAVLEPFRIANRFGLFAVMTRGRWEIEFQGSNDGQNWTAYPFRYKPQDPSKGPGIYAPYQPRFDWNLWFASLGTWRDNMFVVSAEERLLSDDKDVLALFAGNPFANAPPKLVRAVIWQYWFTSIPEKRATGMWWTRRLLGLYAPTVEKLPDGKLGVVQWPEALPPRQ